MHRARHASNKITLAPRSRVKNVRNDFLSYGGRKRRGMKGERERERTGRIPKIFRSYNFGKLLLPSYARHFYSRDLLRRLRSPRRVAKLNPDPRPLDRRTQKGLRIIISILGSIIIAQCVGKAAVDGNFVARRYRRPLSFFDRRSHKGNSLS